ncbi:Protein kinase C-like phorbol ester/diacylglycerol-binding domain [Arabidopsis thaliana x Arabidopsis arenosa]|uniref:Protein kinase C-like phorbol ester/diacylglycerol-binding domain n=1 Tax=Arabidopsis thaliana x Arabidopsis arenosa TaxID=1240361 RepID=A0A8T2A114_9BRAS|nr:Protein kinase C-like phorbol ester/diacylglycerol-binding domain [Arabidopsis thaliana x Arabidopsis arenosa]
MGKLQHGSHECELTSPEIVANGICNICFKDEPVEFACDPCNFDLCKPCSDLPQKMSHHLHPEHPLEFRIGEDDRKTKYMVCVGCGNMSSGTYYYECNKCEIYLDLSCALQKSITTGWEAKEMLHYSHEHQLKRCRPGPDSRGSCLLCEQPLSFTATCYGCVHCYLFFHERCLDLPTEIQHPVHPMHPLKRLDYIQTFDGRKSCSACTGSFVGVPFGCLECGFYLHLRCADALLRGLLYKSHEHRLFYVEDTCRVADDRVKCPCIICEETVVYDSFYYICVECDLKCHTKCLEIPKYVIKKSYHIHQLRYKRVGQEDDFLEYCGVCETTLISGFPAYSCEECDFIGHTECILREEVPSPLYLKDLYSCSKDNTRSKNLTDLETSESEDRLLVNSFNHIHVMRLVHMIELEEEGKCNMCDTKIHGNPCKCETCSFQSHDFCAGLGQPSRHQFHLNHPLTLLPNSPRWMKMTCKSCKVDIKGFNLFCRICNFIIDINCALKDKKMHGALHMGQIGLCIQDKHSLFQVIVSRSYPITCSICDEKLCGKAFSCVMCEDIYHPLCIQVGRRVLVGHPLHSDHMLAISLLESGSKGPAMPSQKREKPQCTACQLNITTKYSYHCTICKINFHIDCIKAVIVPSKIKSHSHYLYNFWNNDMRVTRACSVCTRPCGASFYGCIDCMFSAHVECIGFPANVKNQRHQHTLTQVYTSHREKWSVRESYMDNIFYGCYHCKKRFDTKSIMSTDDREEATQEEQLQDIYLMYLERDLLDLLMRTRI